MNDNQIQNTDPKDIIQPQTAETQTPVSVMDQDEDWRKVREQRKADRKAREEAEARANQKAEEAKALRDALEAITNKPSPVFNTGYAQEETEDERLDKLVEAKMQKLEKQREQERAKREAEEAPRKIRETYPDFDQICSPENMDYVDYHNPELTAPYQYMPEGYKKWELMYKATKKLLPNTEVKKNMQRIDNNMSKPTSVSGIPSIPTTSEAIRLSEDRKAQNWARMQKQLKGVSN